MNCKALRLRHVAHCDDAPRQGLLKLYTSAAEPADLLAGAISRFTTTHCGAGSAEGDFKALLASAATAAQPDDWKFAWADAAAAARVAAEHRRRAIRAVAQVGMILHV